MLRTCNLVESVSLMNPFITPEVSHDWSDLEELAEEAARTPLKHRRAA